MTTTLAPAAASITISSGAGLRVTQIRVLLVARSDIRTCGIEPRLSLPPSRKALKVRDSQSRRIM